MRKIGVILAISVLFLTGMEANAQMRVPYKNEFLNYWNKFKNALKANDADFLFGTIEVPFDGEGSYYNTEAEMDEIKENYMLIYPTYLREMEFVRFSAVLVETTGDNAYIWLGYAPDEDAYFYCYKKMPQGNSDAVTYNEKWWFKRLANGDFKFYRTTTEYN